MKLEYCESDCCSGCAAGSILYALRKLYGLPWLVVDLQPSVFSLDRKLQAWAQHEPDAQAAFALGGARAVEALLVPQWVEAMGQPPKRGKGRVPR